MYHSRGSALAWCVIQDKLTGVRLSLEQGARFKRCMAVLPTRWDFDEDSGGGLHLTRNPRMGKFILDQGAHVNEMSKFGRTPLHVAIENGDLVMAKFLLSYGADINARGYRNLGPSYFHSTPLQCALEHNSHETRLFMAELLIEQKADSARID